MNSNRQRTAELIMESRQLIEFSHELIERAVYLRQYGRVLAMRLVTFRGAGGDGKIAATGVPQDGLSSLRPTTARDLGTGTADLAND
jgi:hypothetical protein